MAAWLKKLIQGGLDDATVTAIKQSDAAVDRVPEQVTKELTSPPRVPRTAPEGALEAQDTRTPLETALDGMEGVTPPQKVARIAPEAAPAPKAPESVADQPTPIDVNATAAQLRGARLETFDLEASHQPNFRVIETEDDIKAVIAQMAERDAPGIEVARARTVASDEQLIALADEMHQDPDTVVQFMKSKDEMPTEAEIVAARKFLHSSAGRLRELAEKVDTGTATDLEKLDFMRQVQLHGEFNRIFMAKRAEAGRRLRVYGLPVGAEPEQLKQMSDLVMTMQGEDVARIASAIKNSDGVSNISGIANAQRTKMQKAGDVVKFLFINSILSGPKTHLVNTLGNTLFQGMNIVELAVAARIGKVLGTAERAEVGEAAARVFGLVTAWRDALRLMKKAFLTGESGIDQVHKVELPMQRPLSAQFFGVSEDSILGKGLDGVSAFLGAPTERFLTAEDDFFKAVTYRGVMAQYAYRASRRALDLGKVDEAGAAALVKQLMDNPTDAMLKAARSEQLELTFQNPLGPKGQKLQSVINGWTALKLLAPFVRTPVNIFKQAGRRSPLAIVMPSFHQAMAAGGVERDLALARLAMGTMTTVVIASAVSDGTVTGGGPSNWKARQLLEATGWQPYSVRAVNPVTGKVTYHSYARAEPLAYVIGATADAAEMFAWQEWDDPRDADNEKAANLAAMLVSAIAENTMSKTFLSGLSDFATLLSEPDRYVEGWVARMTGAFIPYSAFLRDMTKVDDPIMRQALTMREKLAKNIPGYAEGLPAQRDIYGDEKLHPTGDLFGIFSPYPTRDEKPMPWRHEVVDLMQETKRVPITLPSKTAFGIKLTTREYADLVYLSRKVVTIDGMTFEPYLKNQMSQPGFRQLTPDSKVDAMRAIQLGFDKAAREQLRLVYDDEDLGSRIRAREALEYQLATGQEFE